MTDGDLRAHIASRALRKISEMAEEHSDDEGAMLAIPFEVFAKLNPNHPVVLRVMAARTEAKKIQKGKRRERTRKNREARRKADEEGRSNM